MVDLVLFVSRCCEVCGAVLEETAYSSDVAFTKDAGGDSAVVGHFVSDTGQPRGLGRISGGKIYSSDPVSLTNPLICSMIRPHIQGSQHKFLGHLKICKFAKPISHLAFTSKQSCNTCSKFRPGQSTTPKLG